MPRFFFSVCGDPFEDTDGTELADWQTAQVEAIHLAGQVITESAKRLKPGQDWVMEVTNEAGLVLFTLSFLLSRSSAIAGSYWRDNDLTWDRSAGSPSRGAP